MQAMHVQDVSSQETEAVGKTLTNHAALIRKPLKGVTEGPTTWQQTSDGQSKHTC